MRRNVNTNRPRRDYTRVRKKYRLVGHATPDIICEFQVKNELFTIYISPKCKKILGYTAEGVVNTRTFLERG